MKKNDLLDDLIKMLPNNLVKLIETETKEKIVNMKLVEIGLNSIGTIEFFLNIEQKYNFEFSDDVTLLGNEISIKELLDSIKN